MKYIDVVINNNSDNTDQFYTYKCKNESVKIGDKVLVPFARSKKLKEAYVFAINDETEFKNLKEVEEIDTEISLSKDVIEICSWMRRRYYCRYIDAINCFLPTGKASRRGEKRLPSHGDITESKQHILTDEQASAMDKIIPWVDKKKYRTFLIDGVTGSGKTELYMQTVKRVIDDGQNAIMLVPEISLTPQTINRFIGRFGSENVAVLHSKLSLGERYDEWMRIYNGEVKIVIGARSAVFAPVKKLGAIIIDEEHETTYKSDMTPKYDTIEVAIRRANKAGAVVLLGSATPSVVSTYRAEQGLYEKIKLTKRYNEVAMPSISIVDMRKELMSGNKSMFSGELFSDIEKSLEGEKQVILFLNRRGYSPFISCRACGYVMKCDNCGISMTYHKGKGVAVCHYCGETLPVPKVCPECESKYLKHFGIGTEKVEEFTKEAFPEAKISRLDLDTTTKKGSVNKILNDFKAGKSDILIGTQMVAKGLDFSNVMLVGIIAADVGLNIPDFRSAERTFQLITQVAGRAGRGDAKGEVIIQTYMPDNYAIVSAANYDYKGYYDNELMLRKSLKYPPFSDIIQVTIISKKKSIAEREANVLAQNIAQMPGELLGPKEAPLSKIGDDYRYQIHIKAEPKYRKEFEEKLSILKYNVNKDKTNGYRVNIEVNPYSLM